MVSTNKNLINRILCNFSIFIILIPLVNFKTKIMLFYNNKKFFILFFIFLFRTATPHLFEFVAKLPFQKGLY